MRGFFVKLAAVWAAIWAITAPLQAQSFMAGDFDPAIPTVTQVLGYEPGGRMSTSAEALTYLKALAAAAPDRMKVVQYGASWQGRPLTYVLLTAPENFARLDAIQSDLGAIAAGKPGNGRNKG